MRSLDLIAWGKDGQSVFQDFLLVHYYNNVASAEFPGNSGQEAMQKFVSVAS